jgi:hypothetical protein
VVVRGPGSGQNPAHGGSGEAGTGVAGGACRGGFRGAGAAADDVRLVAVCVTVVAAVFVLVAFVLPHSLEFGHQATAPIDPSKAATSGEVRRADAAAIGADDAELYAAAPPPRWTRTAPDRVQDRCDTTDVVLCSRTAERVLTGTGDARSAATTLDRRLRARGWTTSGTDMYVRNTMALHVRWTLPSARGGARHMLTLTLVLRHHYWPGGP